jgi:predicted transcriptional regulator of viral defense system
MDATRRYGYDLTQMSASRTAVAAFLATHPVFRVDDFVAAHAGAGDRSPATSLTLLKRGVAAGRYLHLRRGLYAVVPPGVDPERADVDRFLLASAHTDDAVIAFHAALELHGRAYSAWSRVHVWTHHRSKPWSWRGVEVVPVLADGRGAAWTGVTTHLHAAGTVRVTTLEHTVVDVLDQPDKGGGWEEILRSVAMIEFVDVDAVVADALSRRRALTAARVGWVLALRQAAWHVEEGHLGALQARRPDTPTYLDSSRTPGRLDRKWNLIVPGPLANVTEEVP